jgi:hypothetical protein
MNLLGAAGRVAGAAGAGPGAAAAAAAAAGSLTAARGDLAHSLSLASDVSFLSEDDEATAGELAFAKVQAESPKGEMHQVHIDTHIHSHH